MAVPLVVRVVRGDIADASASLIAVGHFNALPPSGAELAVDRRLGGLITRREAMLRGALGTTHFLPPLASPLVAGAVLVVCLGEPEAFVAARLPEVAGALVEAAATIGARDVATVVHAPGADVAETAEALVVAFLRARGLVAGGRRVRELTLVELDEGRFEAIAAAVRRAGAGGRTVKVIVDAGGDGGPPGPAAEVPAAPARPAPGAAILRLGFTRAGGDLRVTRASEGALSLGCTGDYPAKVATTLPVELRDAIAEPDRATRAWALEHVGAKLGNAFLAPLKAGASAVFDAEHSPVAVVVDGWTAELPWELLHSKLGFVALRLPFARQLELSDLGRQGAFVEPHPRLRALVIGDPQGNLDAARREGEAVAGLLERVAGAEVELIAGPAEYRKVSRALDARSHDVLHFAGHAQYEPGRPGDSGLVLEDGLLTPEDLGARHCLPRLIVANACHASAMDAQLEGAQQARSLTASLLTAGARAFLAAAWQVDDIAAETFAEAFYRAVAPVDEGPVALGEAVRQGRAAVVDRHGIDQPAWAAYTLYGDPRRTALETTGRA